MRWLIVAGLLFVASCGLPPQSESPAPISGIYRDFPELAEWGHVVRIGLSDYWQPDPALCVTAVHVRYAAAATTWVPYGNGYFYDDPRGDLVWVSRDPWGFITEHYGYWRHHAQFGYVWRPFTPISWRPFVASILRTFDGRILGLCPFSRGVWNDGLYEAGFGFDDDYWAPYWGTFGSDEFYHRQAEYFGQACVTVALYDPAHDWLEAPDAHARRDLEYRDHRGHHTWNQAPHREEPRPQPAPAVATGRESRPAESPPRAPAGRVDEPGLPSIPARDLEVKRPAVEPEHRPALEPEHRPALEAKDLHPVEPLRPARAESTTTPGVRPPGAPRAAAAADSVKAPPATPKPAMRATPVKKAPVVVAKDSVAAPSAKDSTAARDSSAAAKKALDVRKKIDKKSP